MPTLLTTTCLEPVSVAESITAARLDSDAGAELTTGFGQNGPGLSPTAVMEPPMFGVMEPATGG